MCLQICTGKEETSALNAGELMAPSTLQLLSLMLICLLLKSVEPFAAQDHGVKTGCYS